MTRTAQTDPGERAARARRFGCVVLILFAVLVAGAATTSLIPWSRLDAQVRAVVVLVSVIRPPVATPIVEGVTGEPQVEETSVAGNPASVFHPAGDGPHPAVVFGNGMIPQGREYQAVREFAAGLARAGYLVVVPDLPGLMDDTITVRTVAEATEVAREVSERKDVRGGSVGFVGVSTGATLALLAAEDPSLKQKISAVVGVAPYTDIRTILALATTAHYELDGRMVPYRSEPLLSYAVARSTISALDPGEGREALLSEMDAVNRDDPAPLTALRNYPTEDLGPEARSVVSLLANQDPERFGELYADLPSSVKADMEKLSPIDGAGQLEAPVELVSGSRDRYFPVSESYQLRQVVPERVVTVTEVLDHSELSISLATLPDLLELNAFAGRAMENLRSESQPTSPP
ncbi:alpha/beta hydrolase family protein [Rubrobacter indicoceani]|uniref:alpha/beta hydrolase family protein n=1 Tax=Rubrobacter indicoceani TaxID=2051957 RepID=UPI0013C46B1A|nr:alpha/beta hydrolase [Rubrobacter indicoceani]